MDNHVSGSMALRFERLSLRFERWLLRFRSRTEQLHTEQSSKVAARAVAARDMVTLFKIGGDAGRTARYGLRATISHQVCSSERSPGRSAGSRSIKRSSRLSTSNPLASNSLSTIAGATS